MLDDFKLHGSFGFLLHYDGTIPDAAAGNDVADVNLHDIAAVQFAVDRDIKERPVLEAPVLVKPEPNVSNLLWCEGALCDLHTALFRGRSSWIAGSNDE